MLLQQLRLPLEVLLISQPQVASARCSFAPCPAQEDSPTWHAAAAVVLATRSVPTWADPFSWPGVPRARSSASARGSGIACIIFTSRLGRGEREYGTKSVSERGAPRRGEMVSRQDATRRHWAQRVHRQVGTMCRQYALRWASDFYVFHT